MSAGSVSLATEKTQAKINNKSGFSDTFLLHLLSNHFPELFIDNHKSSTNSETFSPKLKWYEMKDAEKKYMKSRQKSKQFSVKNTNKRFMKLTKHLMVELYLSLMRILMRNKVPQWRKHASVLSKKDKHNGCRKGICYVLEKCITIICDCNCNEIDINFMYDDILAVHQKRFLFNVKTLKAFMKEEYILGKDNTHIYSQNTQKIFDEWQLSSKRSDFGMTDNPFSHFNFSIDMKILMLQTRQKCPNCTDEKYRKKSSLLYCPYCKSAFPLKLENEQKTNEILIPPPKKKLKTQKILIENDEYGFLPVLKDLPIKVDIIRHPRESVNVCSSVHACVLAPNDVQMFEYPNIPLTYNTNNSTYLLYPSQNAIFLDEMDLTKVEKIVVIENRWSGNSCVYDHPSLRGLPHCQIRNRTTMYWRWQEHSSQYLSTIEAIYYAIVDCYKAQQKINKNLKPYNGEFDDLLLLFAYDHARIRQNIQQNNNRTPNIWA